MLVLSRTRGQLVRIGDEIAVRIIRIDNGAIHIGIIAPRKICVLRGELLHRNPTAPLGAQDGGAEHGCGIDEPGIAP